MKAPLLAVFATALLAASCKTEDVASVDQNRVRTDYELFYDATQNKSTAVATFRFGADPFGTPLQLSGSAEVRFNNDALTFNQVLGRYEKTYDGQINSGSFAYTNVNGRTYTNATPTLTPAEFPAAPAILPLSKTTDNSVTWTGTAIGTNDGIAALLIGTALVVTETTPGTNRLLITAKALQPVASGAYTIVMDRTVSQPLTQQTDVGGTVIAKYRSRAKNVQVSN